MSEVLRLFIRESLYTRRIPRGPRAQHGHPKYVQPDATYGLADIQEPTPDVRGATFEEIADELGFTTSAAHQAVETALDDAKTIGGLIETGDLDLFVLKHVAEYIKVLASSGALSASEIQALRDDPEAVSQLDGFREFLHKPLKRYARELARGVGSEDGSQG